MGDLNEPQKRLLAMVFEQGAKSAGQALSTWLGRPIRLDVGRIDEVSLEEAPELLGASDRLVAACAIEVKGSLNGQLILVFEDQAGLALVDFLLQQPVGTSGSWGDLERSAANETLNIIGCAYLNSLAAHLPSKSDETVLIPGPPTFRHEFAGSLLEFAVMEQAAESMSDRLLLIETRFFAAETELDWTLLYVPGAGGLGPLLGTLGGGG